MTDQCEGNERNPPSPGLGAGKDKKGDDRKNAGGDSSDEEGELPQKNGSRMNNGQGLIKEEETATRGKRADSSRSRYSDIKDCFMLFIYLLLVQFGPRHAYSIFLPSSSVGSVDNLLFAKIVTLVPNG